MKFPKFLNFSRTAKVQKNDVQIEQNYKDQLAKTQQKIESQVDENVKTSNNLGKISESLWDTKHYDENKSRFGGHFIYMIVLIIVAGSEVPLNMMGLEVMRMTKTNTLLMAIFVGLAMATLAHYTGHFLKRGVVEKKSSSMFMAFLAMGAAIAGFWYFAGFRVDYRIRMHLNGGLTQFGNTVLGLFIFTIGVVASYRHTSKQVNTELEDSFYAGLKKLKKGRKIVDSLSEEKEGLRDKRDVELKNYEDWKAAEELRKANAALAAASKAHHTAPTSAPVAHASTTNTQNVATVDPAEELKKNQSKFEDLLKDANRIYNEMVSLVGHITDPGMKTMLMGEVGFVTKKSELRLAISEAKELKKVGAQDDSGELEKIEDSLTKLITV